MIPDIRERKGRQGLELSQANSNEVIERWRQLRVTLTGTERYPKRVSEGVRSRRRGPMAEVVPYISSIGGLVTLLFIARIGLKLIAVNPGTPLGRLVVEVTDLFLWPFAHMTETISSLHIAMLELSSLTAVIVYPFAAWGLIRLLHYFMSGSYPKSSE